MKLIAVQPSSMKIELGVARPSNLRMESNNITIKFGDGKVTTNYQT